MEQGPAVESCATATEQKGNERPAPKTLKSAARSGRRRPSGSAPSAAGGSSNVNASEEASTLNEFLVGYNHATGVDRRGTPVAGEHESGQLQSAPASGGGDAAAVPQATATVVQQSQQMYMAVNMNADSGGQVVLVPVNQVSLPDGRVGFQIQADVPALAIAQQNVASQINAGPLVLTSLGTDATAPGEDRPGTSADAAAGGEDDGATAATSTEAGGAEKKHAQADKPAIKVRYPKAAPAREIKPRRFGNAAHSSGVSVGTHRVEMEGEHELDLQYTSQYRYDEAGNKVPLFQCTLCEYWSNKRYCVVRHMKSHSSHRPHPCTECDARFKTAAALKNHADTHTQVRSYACTSCEYRATTSGELNRHVRYKHLSAGERPHKCPHCDFAAVELSKLKRHVRVHSGERPFKCRYCEYAAIDKPRLQRHERTHTGDKPYACDICGVGFVQGVTMRAHRETHFAMEERRTFACQVCDRRLTRATDLKAHMKRMHSAAAGGLACTVCRQTFADKWSLKVHKKTHRQADRRRCYRCALCPYAAPSAKALEQHGRTHAGHKPYECRACRAAFTQRPQLLRHWRREHDPCYVVQRKEKSFTCRICDRRFHFERNYAKHMEMHQRGMVFLCGRGVYRDGGRYGLNKWAKRGRLGVTAGRGGGAQPHGRAYASARAFRASANARRMCNRAAGASGGAMSVSQLLHAADLVPVKWAESRRVRGRCTDDNEHASSGSDADDACADDALMAGDSAPAEHKFAPPAPGKTKVEATPAIEKAVADDDDAGVRTSPPKKMGRLRAGAMQIVQRVVAEFHSERRARLVRTSFGFSRTGGGARSPAGVDVFDDLADSDGASRDGDDGGADAETKEQDKCASATEQVQRMHAITFGYDDSAVDYRPQIDLHPQPAASSSPSRAPPVRTVTIDGGATLEGEGDDPRDFARDQEAMQSVAHDQHGFPIVDADAEP